MRILGKKSLSSVVKVFVDISYYMSILVAVALIVAAVVVYFWNPKHVSQDIPIAFELDPSAYHISSESWKLEEARITEATGRLRLLTLCQLKKTGFSALVPDAGSISAGAGGALM